MPPGALWQDRGDLTKLDLYHGPGGVENQPGTQFQFLKESKGGTAPKFEVQDENGTRWKVKLGEEARTESVAARLVWAAGYHTDEDYYRPEIHVNGLKKLSRGNKYIQEGTAVGVRLERQHGGPDPTPWSWFENPFTGTRELNGLRVLMALMNGWDLKEMNNSVYMRTDGSVYVVSDLGATFGKSGNIFTRSKGNPKDYSKSRFIDQVTAGQVDFVLHSQPFFGQLFVNYDAYAERRKMPKVAKAIPIEDARWIGNHLSQLSTKQIADGFRSSGFTPSEVDLYTRVVMQRIAELTKL